MKAIDIHPDTFPNLSVEELVKQDNVFSNPIILGGTIRGGTMFYGAGNKCLKFTESEGLWMGNADFNSAPFRVTMAGAVTCQEITTNASDIAGNTADITTNATGISACVSDITGNTTQIGINASGISANVTDIAGNVTNIGINATGISACVSDIAGNTTNIGINASGISTNVTDISGNSSSITQNATNINLRVEKDDVINQINISPEEILIAGINIQLNGDTTVEGSFSVSGDVVSGGTITGSILQSGVPGTGDWIELVDNTILFYYDNDAWGSISTTYNPATYFFGTSLSSGGGTGLSAFGKGNMGAVELTLDMVVDEERYGAWFGLDWFGGSGESIRIVGVREQGEGNYETLPFDMNLLPYGAALDLGSAAKDWRNLYLSGNIVVGGTVDGVDIATFKSSFDSHKARHYAGGADAVIRTSIASGSNLGISAGWAYTHKNSASAHHSKTTSGDISLASMAEKNHSSLAGVSASQHHTKYSDTDARTAMQSSVAYIRGDSGVMRFNYPGRLQIDTGLDPSTAGTKNLGGNDRYWNEVHCKSVVDHSSIEIKELELIDGKKVSAVESIKNLKRKSEKDNELDKKSFPKIAYKEALIAEKDIYEDKKLVYKKGQKMGEDGTLLTIMISVLYKAVKELDERLEKLEKI